MKVTIAAGFLRSPVFPQGGLEALNFFRRLFKIGQANANAILDQWDDPIKMIDQILRELDEDIAKVTAAVTTQMAVEKRFECELQETIETIEKRDLQARRALEMGDENLARQALIDKKRHADKKAALQAGYDKAKAISIQLRKQLDEMKAKAEEMKTERSVLLAQSQAASAKKKFYRAMSGVGSGSLSANFMRLKEKVQQMHDEADAARELAEANKTLDEQFAELMRDSEKQSIEEELEALRAEIGKNA
jgi:phage shock protein A